MTGIAGWFLGARGWLGELPSKCCTRYGVRGNEAASFAVLSNVAQPFSTLILSDVDFLRLCYTLNKMKRRGGYTILEVMIFLAVSSVMFIYAVIAIGGRQKQVQYSQAVRETENQFSDAVNDIASGFFPKQNNIICTKSGSGALERVAFVAGSKEQGSSDSCASVGKVLMFNVDGVEPSQYLLGTLVGVKPPFSQAALPSVIDMKPRLAYDPTPGVGLNLNENKPLRFGIRVTKIFNNASPSKEYGMLAVAAGFDASAASQKNGLMQTVLYASTIGFNQSVDNYAQEIEGLNKLTIEQPADGVSVCLSYDGRLARIVIGERGDPTNIRSELDFPEGGLCG